jgi:hypothetical protein
VNSSISVSSTNIADGHYQSDESQKDCCRKEDFELGQRITSGAITQRELLIYLQDIENK